MCKSVKISDQKYQKNSKANRYYQSKENKMQLFSHHILLQALTGPNFVAVTTSSGGTSVNDMNPSKNDDPCLFRRFAQKELTPSIEYAACKNINRSSKDAAHKSLVTTDSRTVTIQSDSVDSRSSMTSSLHDTLLFLSGSSSWSSSTLSGSLGSASVSASSQAKSQASGTPIAGIDRMMPPREDALSSSESFIYQRMSIFEKMEKKIQGTYIFYFY